MREQYHIKNIDQIDSPALVVYPEIVADNISKVIQMIGDTTKIRPHVKTNKMVEVCQMMIKAGITKFKCATIAEAEMLAISGALDVLLAYQPVGPKVSRLFALKKHYPNTSFACLVDNEQSALKISAQCTKEKQTLTVFIDLNVGMNRTGIIPEKAIELAKYILSLENLQIGGIHGYDGQIHDEDMDLRKKAADISYAQANHVFEEIQSLMSYPLVKIMGGTPTFMMHAKHEQTECSPGTFVFWDWGYAQMLKEMPFQYAALLITRVISIVDKHHICIDLGYKSLAAESPLPRIQFLNAPDATPVAQSEEHLVLEVSDSTTYILGDVLYGVPVHICPTVALYEKVFVVNNNEMTDAWRVIARDRFINF